MTWEQACTSLTASTGVNLRSAITLSVRRTSPSLLLSVNKLKSGGRSSIFLGCRCCRTGEAARDLDLKNVLRVDSEVVLSAPRPLGLPLNFNSGNSAALGDSVGDTSSNLPSSSSPELGESGFPSFFRPKTLVKNEGMTCPGKKMYV